MSTMLGGGVFERTIHVTVFIPSALPAPVCFRDFLAPAVGTTTFGVEHDDSFLTKPSYSSPPLYRLGFNNRLRPNFGSG